MFLAAAIMTSRMASSLSSPRSPSLPCRRPAWLPLASPPGHDAGVEHLGSGGDHGDTGVDHVGVGDEFCFHVVLVF